MSERGCYADIAARLTSPPPRPLDLRPGRQQRQYDRSSCAIVGAQEGKERERRVVMRMIALNICAPDWPSCSSCRCCKILGARDQTINGPNMIALRSSGGLARGRSAKRKASSGTPEKKLLLLPMCRWRPEEGVKGVAVLRCVRVFCGNCDSGTKELLGWKESRGCREDAEEEEGSEANQGANEEEDAIDDAISSSCDCDYDSTLRLRPARVGTEGES